MLGISDNLSQSVASLRAYRMRAALTMLGLTMGVSTVITVMTLIQGANLYVEQKVANLGTNVFQVGRLPFASADFKVVLKALRNKHITLEDGRGVAERCPRCEHVGARSSSRLLTQYRDRELQNSLLIGQTANMVHIDTRTILQGRYFTEAEEERSARVGLVGAKLVEELFHGIDPLGRVLRAGSDEFTVIGVYEKIGSVLGQEQDNYLVVPMSAYQKIRGRRLGVTLEIKAIGPGQSFQQAQDEARVALRARRHLGPNAEDDFFIGTASSYISLFESISSAFFAVFLMVSVISAMVGGIVIMNVMLVSVTERTKEIGVRRALGATRSDILRQFLAESVLQCLIGGLVGVAVGFAAALALRSLTDFPASVRTWVAILGLGLSSGIGLFFGIYPATRAARLDPVAALRSE